MYGVVFIIIRITEVRQGTCILLLPRVIEDPFISRVLREAAWIYEKRVFRGKRRSHAPPSAEGSGLAGRRARPAAPADEVAGVSPVTSGAARGRRVLGRTEPQQGEGCGGCARGLGGGAGGGCGRTAAARRCLVAAGGGSRPAGTVGVSLLAPGTSLSLPYSPAATVSLAPRRLKQPHWAGGWCTLVSAMFGWVW